MERFKVARLEKFKGNQRRRMGIFQEQEEISKALGTVDSSTLCKQYCSKARGNILLLNWIWRPDKSFIHKL